MSITELTKQKVETINYEGDYIGEQFDKIILDNKLTTVVKDTTGCGATYRVELLNAVTCKQKIILVVPTVHLVRDKQRECRDDMNFKNLKVAFLYGEQQGKNEFHPDNTAQVFDECEKYDLIITTPDQLTNHFNERLLECKFHLVLDEIHMLQADITYRVAVFYLIQKIIPQFIGNGITNITATLPKYQSKEFKNFRVVKFVNKYRKNTKIKIIRNNINYFNHLMEMSDKYVCFSNERKFIVANVALKGQMNCRAIVGADLKLKLTPYIGGSSDFDCNYIFVSSAGMEGVNIDHEGADIFVRCVLGRDGKGYGINNYSPEKIVQALGRIRYKMNESEKRGNMYVHIDTKNLDRIKNQQVEQVVDEFDIQNSSEENEVFDYAETTEKQGDIAKLKPLTEEELIGKLVDEIRRNKRYDSKGFDIIETAVRNIIEGEKILNDKNSTGKYFREHGYDVEEVTGADYNKINTKGISLLNQYKNILLEFNFDSRELIKAIEMRILPRLRYQTKDKKDGGYSLVFALKFIVSAFLLNELLPEEIEELKNVTGYDWLNFNGFFPYNILSNIPQKNQRNDANLIPPLVNSTTSLIPEISISATGEVNNNLDRVFAHNLLYNNTEIPQRKFNVNETNCISFLKLTEKNIKNSIEKRQFIENATKSKKIEKHLNFILRSLKYSGLLPIPINEKSDKRKSKPPHNSQWLKIPDTETNRLLAIWFQNLYITNYSGAAVQKYVEKEISEGRMKEREKANGTTMCAKEISVSITNQIQMFTSLYYKGFRSEFLMKRFAREYSSVTYLGMSIINSFTPFSFLEIDISSAFPTLVDLVLGTHLAQHVYNKIMNFYNIDKDEAKRRYNMMLNLVPEKKSEVGKIEEEKIEFFENIGYHSLQASMLARFSSSILKPNPDEFYEDKTPSEIRLLKIFYSFSAKEAKIIEKIKEIICIDSYINDSILQKLYPLMLVRRHDSVLITGPKEVLTKISADFTKITQDKPELLEMGKKKIQVEVHLSDYFNNQFIEADIEDLYEEEIPEETKFLYSEKLKDADAKVA
jgi:hypothetical protein